ncbi:hypothetical protein C2E23DRAFT_883536 [Lenzites betulinus]|nr:hypothetical protein C2E23DRAFT_883536 [Lenzites betulinus]
MKDNMTFPTALAALLVAAAPHLSTLCVVTSDSPLGTLAIPCTFPKLEELSLKGTELVFNPSLPTSVFPALKRIHFVSLGLSTTMETLSRAELPSLTHLRISNLDQFQMACMLVEALRNIPHQGPPAPPSSTSLSRPRHIIVHSTRPAVAGWSAYHNSAWIAFTHSLRALVQAQNQENDGLRALLLLRPMGSGRWIRRMQCQWLDRMQGGCGCWVESEAEEAASEVK